ncbi:MAG: DUF6273 domain-containing protein [Ruminiclostridium sp.]
MTAKRFTAAVLAAAITLSATACNNSADNTEQSFNTPSPGGNIAVGEYVKFGDYNWQVLEVRNGNALIISERILDYKPYNNTPAETTWEECDLRRYLNNDFYNSFSDKERQLIMPVKNENPDNPWDFSQQGGCAATEGGKDTEDYIFLLSLDEIVRYFSTDGQDSMLYQSQLGAREMKLSDGCEKSRLAYNLSGDITNPTGSAWFLRSPGMYQENAAYIGSKGSIAVCGTWVEGTSYGMRPAMWVKNAGSLEKSVVVCSDPDCSACKSGVYSDNPKEDSKCIICGYGRACKDKIAHNRLYHDWVYNCVYITKEMLDEIYKIEDTFKQVWLDIFKLLQDGQSSLDSSKQKIRISQVVSNEVSNRITALEEKEITTTYNYRSMTPQQFAEKKAYLENRTALLKEVKSVIQQAVADANASAVTFEENTKRFFSALLIEILREKVKNQVSDTNEKLWDAGYYHALFGDLLAGIAYDEFEQLSQDKIDELFGSNKLLEWENGGGAMLDGYLEAVFFGEN